MNEKDYFLIPRSTKQKQYEALRAYFVDEFSAKEVASKFGYTPRAFTSLVADFRKQNKEKLKKEIFFQVKKPGRKEMQQKPSIVAKVVELRKTYISVPDIKVILDGQNIKVSEKEIYLIVKQEGFARLPRRSQTEKQTITLPKITPETSSSLEYSFGDLFSSNSAGLFYFWPFIKLYGIDEIIQKSGYPETKSISKFSSIMSFLALKLSNARRYSADDLWCMDRGQGLFAGLNVLPKAAWFSSYSYRQRRIILRF